MFDLIVENGVEIRKYDHIALQELSLKGRKTGLSSSSLKVLTPTSAYRQKALLNAEIRTIALSTMPYFMVI